MNTQRDVIYTERSKILEGADLKANVMDMVREEITALWQAHIPERQEEQWDHEGLFNEVSTIVRLPSNLAPQFLTRLSRDEVLQSLLSYADEAYERKESEIGPQTMRTLERLVMLRTIDSLWVEHLTATEEMRQGIGLHAYGQADPRVVYKREARDMWDQFLANIRHQITRNIYHVELAPSTPAPARQPAAVGAGRRAAAAADAAADNGAQSSRSNRPVTRKVGRNDPCPCGSGKKYKKCHGMAA
jgi:preprotein translocase subunit SecA